jgi:hypothetical protein
MHGVDMALLADVGVRRNRTRARAISFCVYTGVLMHHPAVYRHHLKKPWFRGWTFCVPEISV